MRDIPSRGVVTVYLSCKLDVVPVIESEKMQMLNWRRANQVINVWSLDHNCIIIDLHLLVDALRCNDAIFGWDLCRWLPCLYWPLPIFAIICACVCVVIYCERCNFPSFCLSKSHFNFVNNQISSVIIMLVPVHRINSWWWHKAFVCVCPSNCDISELTEDDKTNELIEWCRSIR